MVKLEWLKFYERGAEPAKFDRTFQSWDTANKAGDLNDFSVCTTWGVKGKNYYLLDVFRKRLIFPDLKRAVLDLRLAVDGNEQARAECPRLREVARMTAVQNVEHAVGEHQRPRNSREAGVKVGRRAELGFEGRGGMHAASVTCRRHPANPDIGALHPSGVKRQIAYAPAASASPTMPCASAMMRRR